MSATVPNINHPEGAARVTLSAALDAAGPSWADLADAIENGTNYENDTIHISIALKAIVTAFTADCTHCGQPKMSSGPMTTPINSEGLDALVERLEATIHRINNHWWNKRARPTAPDIAEAIATLRASSLPLRGEPGA